MPGGWKTPFFIGIGGGYPPVVPPALLAWTLGPLWSISVICAKNGFYGLQRSGDGVTGSSNVTSTKPFTVTPGSVLFGSFWLKAGVNANGQISFGLAFADVNGAALPSQYIMGSGFSQNWVQFSGNLTVPPGAVTATPTVRAVGHTSGFWCVDSVLFIATGGNFTLSALRHYWSDYVLYR